MYSKVAIRVMVLISNVYYTLTGWHRAWQIGGVRGGAWNCSASASTLSV